MPLQAYDFNPYYAWVRDAYSLTWQLHLNEAQETAHEFQIGLLFGGKQTGLAGPALDYYQEHLGAIVHSVAPYPDFPGKVEAAKIVYAFVTLLGQPFVFMDHGAAGRAEFTGAFSLSLACQTQADIYRYWDILCKVHEAEACGWCQDDFGLS